MLLGFSFPNPYKYCVVVRWWCRRKALTARWVMVGINTIGLEAADAGGVWESGSGGKKKEAVGLVSGGFRCVRRARMRMEWGGGGARERGTSNFLCNLIHTRGSDRGT